MISKTEDIGDNIFNLGSLCFGGVEEEIKNKVAHRFEVICMSKIWYFLEDKVWSQVGRQICSGVKDLYFDNEA